MLQTYAEEAITVSDTAVGLDENASGNLYSSPPPDETEITISGAQVRFRRDGTAATNTVGEIRNPYDPPIILRNRDDMINFSAIRAGSTNVTLWIKFKRNS